MVQSKTIDNLGVEHSVRWAQDQAYLDKALTKESSFVSLNTQIDVSEPYYKGEFDTLFQLNRRFAPWALLSPPSGYTIQKMRLFTFQAVPSLGTQEFLSTQVQKIQEQLENAKKKRAEKRKKGKGAEYSWEDEKEDEADTIALLEYLQTIDTMITQINSRRNQYSKG